MGLLKKIVVLSICLGISLYAEWSPSSLHQGNPRSAIILSNPKYTALKTQVTQALTNSWCSAEKINLLMDVTLLIHPRVCVEIGAFTGSSILPVAATLKYLNSGKVFAVDAWSNAETIKYLAKDDPNRAWWSQVDMQAVRNSFQRLIKTWSLGSFCTEIYKPSEQAIYSIPGEIDFLHLDGDYSEIGALRDVEVYLPKVKSGGYILLSNLYIMINREQPKIKAFVALCEACEIIASIEKDNAVLFRKN
jgi:hypothetical protein